MQNNERPLDTESANRFFRERNGGPQGLIIVAGYCPNEIHAGGEWYGAVKPTVVDISRVEDKSSRRMVIEEALNGAIERVNRAHDGLDGCHMRVNIRAIGKIGNEEVVLMSK